jgi:hypothetical protein
MMFSSDPNISSISARCLSWLSCLLRTHWSTNSRPVPNLRRSKQLSTAVVQPTYRVHIVLISINILNTVL